MRLDIQIEIDDKEFLAACKSYHVTSRAAWNKQTRSEWLMNELRAKAMIAVNDELLSNLPIREDVRHEMGLTR